MKEPKTISKLTFEVMVFGLMLVLQICEMTLAVFVVRVLGLGHKIIGGLVCGLSALNLIFATHLLDRFLKSRGLSRSGRIVEGRLPSPIERPSADEESVSIRYSRRFSNTLALSHSAFFLLIVLFWRFGATGQKDEWFAIPGLVMFGSFAVLSFLMQFFDIVKVGPSGITGYRSKFSLRPSFTPWDEVAHCEIITLRNTFGEVSLVYPKMADVSGRVLFPSLPQALIYISKTDRDRLLRFLKRRFPKIEYDPWE